MKTKIVKTLKLPIIFVAIIWAIHAVSFVLGLDLKALGVYPREVFGLKGILFSPLIHGDWGHLLSNTTPLFVLSVIVIYFYRRVAIPAFLLIYFFSGVAVWLFARPAFHIGASGFVYGLVAFVFWTGIFRKNMKSIALALIVVFYYGSMIFGVLPLQEEISWEGHLFGALAGVFASWLFMNRIEVDEQKPVYSWEKEAELEKQSFFPSDTFDKTKDQRTRESIFTNWTSDHT